MHRATPGRPLPSRRAAAAAAVAVATATCVALGLVAGGSLAVVVVRDVGAAAVLALTTLVLARRADTERHHVAERDVWRWFSRAAAVISVGAVARLVLDAAAAPVVGLVHPAVPAAAFGLGVLVACPLLYQGLLHWNRHRSLVADPGDWLNGLSAVFAIVGAANLALSWSGSSLTRLPAWVLQGSLFRVAAVVVLLGTTMTVASLGGLRHDVRVWVVSSAFVVGAAGELLSLHAGDAGTWSVAGWLLAVAALAWCTVRPPAMTAPRQATPEAPTIGALVVLVASVAVLVADSERHARSPGAELAGTGWPIAQHLPTVCAVVAVLGVAARVVHLVRDLATLAQTRHEARTDDLTGVANRRALMAHLDERLGGSDAVSLLVVDLDRFKVVNDRYGHAAGDALLRTAASRLRALVPADGLLARLGGDEFAVVVRVDEEHAVALGRRLARTVAAIVEADGHPVHTGASIGVAVGSDLDGDELRRRADAAMYRAKSTGAGVCHYDERVDRAVRERAARLEELRVALDPAHPARHDQFVVHYQPQLDVVSGDVAGVEALVRWEHPEHGLLAPGDFLDLVEEHGLMPQITAHVLRTAAAQAALWQRSGRPLRVAVNLSASVLVLPGLLPLVDDVLATTGVDPALLVLEVTETTLMADAERGLAAARAIAERGVGLSIDDYGTGHSALSYLHDLPASELKLDRSFVGRMLADDRTAAIVAATVDLAHRLGLRLIAEGVEDDPTLEALRLLGCDESQGYLHCRPRPLHDLEEWLTQRRAVVPTPRRTAPDDSVVPASSAVAAGSLRG